MLRIYKRIVEKRPSVDQNKVKAALREIEYVGRDQEGCKGDWRE